MRSEPPGSAIARRLTLLALVSAMALGTVGLASAQAARTTVAVDAEIRELGERYFGGYVQVYANHELCGEWSFTDPAQRTPDGGAEFELGRAGQPEACGRVGATITFFDGNYVGLSNEYTLEPGTRILVDWFYVGAREGLDDGPTEDGLTFLTLDAQLLGDTIKFLDVYADGEACGRFSFADHPTAEGGAEFEIARDDQPAACGREGAIITLFDPNGTRLAGIYRLRLGFETPILNFTIAPPDTGAADAPTPEAPEVGSGLATEAGRSGGSRVAGVATVVLLTGIAAYVVASRCRA